MFNVYRKLWDLILLRERKKGIFLIISMIFFGIIETFGIVSIFPLVSVISNPKIIETNEYLNFFLQLFQLSINKQIFNTFNKLYFWLLLLELFLMVF